MGTWPSPGLMNGAQAPYTNPRRERASVPTNDIQDNSRLRFISNVATASTEWKWKGTVPKALSMHPARHASSSTHIAFMADLALFEFTPIVLTGGRPRNQRGRCTANASQDRLSSHVAIHSRQPRNGPQGSSWGACAEG